MLCVKSISIWSYVNFVTFDLCRKFLYLCANEIVLRWKACRIIVVIIAAVNVVIAQGINTDDTKAIKKLQDTRDQEAKVPLISDDDVDK